MSRRDLILVIASGVLALGVIITLIVVLTGGGKGPKPIDVAETAPAATVTAILTPSPSPAGPPTFTPSPMPTATLEPYQYQVKAGDTLFAIIQIYGYRDIGVVPEVIRLNNMANENDLKADQILLIPQQTPTVGPTDTPSPTLEPGITPTATIEATIGPTPDYTGCNKDTRCTSPDGKYWMHEVQEGDTIASIAYQYYAPLDAVLQANGLTKDSFIVPGQKLKVPIMVTLTPTLTPTGGPDSTATPIPTLSPPALLAPVDGETVPRGDSVVLQWIAGHPLASTENYLVIVRIVGGDQEHRATTHSNSYRLPDGLKPGIGKTVQFEWQVVVITGSNTNATAISGLGPTWHFTWGP
jgi:LysM repeat protein